jgi:hypothetical protein
MTDYVNHPAVREARDLFIRRFRSIASDAYWIVPPNSYPEVDRIIADAVRKVCEPYWRALKTIASYDSGNGCCDYGCDTPTIAKEALAVQPESEARDE